MTAHWPGRGEEEEQWVPPLLLGEEERRRSSGSLLYCSLATGSTALQPLSQESSARERGESGRCTTNRPLPPPPPPLPPFLFLIHCLLLLSILLLYSDIPLPDRPCSRTTSVHLQYSLTFTFPYLLNKCVSSVLHI